MGTLSNVTLALIHSALWLSSCSCKPPYKTPILDKGITYPGQLWWCLIGIVILGNNNNNNNNNGRSLENVHNPFLVNERRKRDLSEDFLDYQSLFELEYLLRKHLLAGQTSRWLFKQCTGNQIFISEIFFFPQYLNNLLSNITEATLVQLPGKQLSRYLFKQIENSVDQVTRSCAETDQETDICQIFDSILF